MTKKKKSVVPEPQQRQQPPQQQQDSTTQILSSCKRNPNYFKSPNIKEKQWVLIEETPSPEGKEEKNIDEWEMIEVPPSPEEKNINPQQR